MGLRAQAITASLLVLAVWWRAGQAAAQLVPRQGFRLERLASAPSAEDGFALTLPSTLGHLRWSSMLSLGYAARPFVLRGPPERDLVSQRLGGELNLAVGVLGTLEAYARLPCLLASAGEAASIEQTTFDPAGGFALGDASVGGTLSALRLHGLGVGVRAELLLPTGNAEALMGDYAIAPRGHALVSYELGRLTLGAEGGAVYRPNRDYGLVRIGSEAEWVLGARARALAAFDVWVEAFGTRSLRRPEGAAALDTLDLLLGGRHRAQVGTLVLCSGGGIGVGVSDAAGDPGLRLLFSVAVTSAELAQSATVPRSRSALVEKP